jgi:hypothetical protein
MLIFLFSDYKTYFLRMEKNTRPCCNLAVHTKDTLSSWSLPRLLHIRWTVFWI